MKNLKNIYLIGPSRCGKTTTATMLQEKYGYTHIIMDAVIETMAEVAPELGIRHGNLNSQAFQKFLISYSRNLFKYTKPNIIDLEVLNPDFAQTLIDSDESVVIYMGYPSITPEEKAQQIRQYDTEFDWTRTLSDEELIVTVQQQIESSKRLQKEAHIHDFEFIDTSYNRERIIAKKIEELFNSGRLYRTDSSYDKYIRE